MFQDITNAIKQLQPELTQIKILLQEIKELLKNK